ncbi:Nif11-like leader peptide family natural product precursor [Nonomuraea turcica]|uniref:Nif11-like leader peptide family natural product precursor n=1 Tax=Nonomuraea sp. G32 TaxID=3067274 RepID=UPI00273C35F8|nr:Nif11-like leader peptide family natural product precursor [Nonomuraea sp. G32]MDP4506221.1 Nif11-like leader peptide family natural product precursor [Nonomuraea sp. G32]
MSETEFVRFLESARSDPGLLARYSPMDLPQVLFHARNEGFAFTQADAERVIGRLEAGVIVDKDKEPFDGGSTLWRHMWGTRYLDYLVHHVVARFTDEELS